MVENFRSSLSSCAGYGNLKHVFVASHGSSLDQYNSWGLLLSMPMRIYGNYVATWLNIVEQTMHFSVASL